MLIPPRSYEYFFDRARIMMRRGTSNVDIVSVLVREGASFDIAYFALVGASIARREDWYFK